MQRVVKYSSLSYFIVKPPYLITQGFKNNKRAHEKLFNHMCNFGARAEFRDMRRVVSFYPDVDISNDKYHLVNPIPLECIAG